MKFGAFSVEWPNTENLVRGLVKLGKNVVGVYFAHIHLVKLKFFQAFQWVFRYFDDSTNFHHLEKDICK